MGGLCEKCSVVASPAATAAGRKGSRDAPAAPLHPSAPPYPKFGKPRASAGLPPPKRRSLSREDSATKIQAAYRGSRVRGSRSRKDGGPARRRSSRDAPRSSDRAAFLKLAEEGALVTELQVARLLAHPILAGSSACSRVQSQSLMVASRNIAEFQCF